MPIPAGSLAGPYVSGDTGRPTATFTDPDGVMWDLTDISPEVGFFTTPAVAGLYARPYEYTLDQLPRDGADVRAVHGKEARIIWPLHVYSDGSHMEWLERFRAIRNAFMKTAWRRQAGILTVTRPDGSARSIDVLYEAGFDGQLGGGTLSANPVITLIAPDGYWRSVDPFSEARTFAAGTSFLAPFPTVSPGYVLGDTTVINPGDVEAWPSWTITGPSTVVTATNTSTNQQWALTYNLSAGEVVTVTTKRPTVRGPVGQNLVGQINWPEAYLWPLRAGSNAINFTVAGAATGTAILMTYYPRFEGA